MVNSLESACKGRRWRIFKYFGISEYQNRGVIHFHVLIDKPVNFDLIHTLWNRWAGFARPERILLFGHVVRYVTKYVSKGGEIIPYFTDMDIEPMFLPNWWKPKSILDQD